MGLRLAGLRTGLSRVVGPAEWPLVELKEHQLGGDKRRLWLDVVDLAQRHDGRSLTYRTLDISGYRPDTVKAIERMVTNSRAWVTEGKIQQRRSECTQLLYEVCDRIFPSQGIKLSLFTFRHQFIANMKTLMHRAHVIAMAGSVDIDYKSEHYAKRRAAWKSSDIRDIPAPSEEQVERVLNYLKLVEDRKAVMRPTAMRRQEQDDEKF